MLLNPVLVSVVMTCCVAYTDKIHLHGTTDAIPGSTRPGFPSLLPTDPVCANFYFHSWNLLISAVRSFSDFRLDSTFYCLRIYILLSRVAHVLTEALCSLRPSFSVTSYQPKSTLILCFSWLASPCNMGSDKSTVNSSESIGL